MAQVVVNGQRREAREGEVPTYAPPSPKPDDVRREATRRIDAIVDRREQLRLIQRALRLIMKVTIEQKPLTQAEQAEIAAESQVRDRIEAIQAAEKRLLAMDPIPTDYTADKWWTA